MLLLKFLCFSFFNLDAHIFFFIDKVFSFFSFFEGLMYLSWFSFPMSITNNPLLLLPITKKFQHANHILRKVSEKHFWISNHKIHVCLRYRKEYVWDTFCNETYYNYECVFSWLVYVLLTLNTIIHLFTFVYRKLHWRS